MTDLPVIMASLGIADEDHSPPKPCRSGLRRRSLPMKNPTPKKRRCNLQPKKLDDPADNEQIINYYLNKKINLSVRKELETIYEEPRCNKNGSVSYLGAIRQRRIAFCMVSKAKLKKRKSMLKKANAGSKLKRNCRLSMDEFLTRMQCSMSKSNDKEALSSKPDCQQ